MKALQINPKDNVAVALEEIKLGETITINKTKVVVKENIPKGHKFAVNSIKNGGEVIKYGYPIGIVKCDVPIGGYIHTNQLKSGISDSVNYTYSPNYEMTKQTQPRSFFGYRRENGRVGVRNEIWIIPTVGCVNSIACSVEKQAQSLATGSIDGIYAFNHAYGCSQLGNDQEMTLDFLCGLINNPNAGGVLVMGLGCENGNVEELKKKLGEYDERRVKFVVCQETDDEIHESLKLIRQLCCYASRFKREPCSSSELIIGLKCGGSDGFSGITANPVLGRVTDKITAEGGSAILTEVPEMFGAETILMNRCKNEAVFNKTVRLINDFKSYFKRYNEPVDENPSPGNKAGGITTLAEKSLGCVQKSGNAVVSDVLNYSERVMEKGLSLLQAPGNDLVASCTLAASGAQIIVFTTGRGTPFGCPVPTLKVSSNTEIFNKKCSWIDFDAGKVLSGGSYEETAEELYKLILSVASGETKAKAEGLDKHNLAIFKDGVTL